MQHNFLLKRTLLLAFAMLAFGTSQAQNWFIKAGGGFASHYDSDTRTVGSFSFGAGYNIPFGSSEWSISPMLTFYAKGWKDSDYLVPVLDDEGKPVIDENGNQRMSLCNRTGASNYIELPVLLNYAIDINDTNALTISAGPYVAVGIGGKVKVKGDAERPGSEKLFYSQETFDADGTKRVDAGIQAGAAYSFNSHFSLGLEADFGLAKFNAASRRNVSALISLTYRFVND